MRTECVDPRYELNPNQTHWIYSADDVRSLLGFIERKKKMKPSAFCKSDGFRSAGSPISEDIGRKGNVDQLPGAGVFLYKKRGIGREGITNASGCYIELDASCRKRVAKIVGSGLSAHPPLLTADKQKNGADLAGV